MSMRNSVLGASVALIASLGVLACGDSTGVDGPQNVVLNFRVTGGAALASASPSLAGGPNLVAGPPMTLAGTNGSLTITEIRIIIAEVELESVGGSCDDDDDCPDFEAPPRFLDLPLDGEPIAAVTGLIPPGTYKELEFEVEDLELDDDDDEDEDDLAEAAAIAAVRAEILSAFPDWPEKASALVVGTFEPVGGSAIDFRVYLEAEVEVELDLLPHLVVADDGTLSRSLTVDIRPDIWFVRSDGSVLPLHLWDFDVTGRLLEFELEMEDGFTEIEIDG